MEAIIRNLRWQSDWNGYEVGFDDVLVVGLYTSDELACDFYINIETLEILEVMPHNDDEY